MTAVTAAAAKPDHRGTRRETGASAYGDGVPAIRYLSRKEVAERIGVKPDTLSRYSHLPEPDAVIGDVRGWLPRTIDQWHAARPSQTGR
jgi:hypothetical protein